MSNRRAAHHIAIFYSLHTKLGSGLSGEEQCVNWGRDHTQSPFRQ